MGKENRAKTRARKQAGMLNPGKKSKYAIKHAQQVKGVFRKTSPFYLSPAERERLEAVIEK